MLQHRCSLHGFEASWVKPQSTPAAADRRAAPGTPPAPAASQSWQAVCDRGTASFAEAAVRVLTQTAYQQAATAPVAADFPTVIKPPAASPNLWRRAAGATPGGDGMRSSLRYTFRYKVLFYKRKGTEPPCAADLFPAGWRARRPGDGTPPFDEQQHANVKPGIP
jgi:hypothetical protein